MVMGYMLYVTITQIILAIHITINTVLFTTVSLGKTSFDIRYMIQSAQLTASIADMGVESALSSPINVSINSLKYVSIF